MDRRKRFGGFMVAESRIRLLSPAVAAANLLEGWVSVSESAESDFTSAISSESSEERSMLKKSPSLMIEAGRFLLVATEYHATAELVDSSKTRSESQSFWWPPVTEATNDRLPRSQWSLMAQSCAVLSPISAIAEAIRGRKRLRESLTQSLMSENDSVVVELPERNSLTLCASSITATILSRGLSPVIRIDLEFRSSR